MPTFDQLGTKPENSSPERRSRAADETEAEVRHQFVYDLRLDGGNSERFYTDVAGFSARVVAEIKNRAAAGLGGYSRYVTSVLGQAPRSRCEYALELLTVGMAIRLYGDVAAATPRGAMDLARELYRLRRRSPRMKPLADFLRAGLFHLFMRKKMLRARTLLARTQARTQTNYDGLPRLVEWLQATGEFEQEWRRVENWRRYWGELPRCDAEHWVAESIELFDWFTGQAEVSLGKYTAGVIRFLEKTWAMRCWREDQIFCGRLPVEYHLGMVASEVMNDVFRENFLSKPRKVVLVPTCMRGARASTCKAVTRGLDTTCMACDPDCAINRITKRMRYQAIDVYMVPHSSGFSRWLKRWQNDPQVGVAAVACMMNILPGGYEMRARRIASQCVPLDCPGCAKHWESEAVPTSVNEERLVQIVRGARE